jgi:uncharacterized protein DUF4199
MRKVVVTFGLLSGAVSASLMLMTVPFMHRIGFDYGLVVGYTAIVLSFLFVYFGIRSYRDNVAGGTVTFGRAFGIGLMIAVISSLCYVITWEFVYFNLMPDFWDKYSAYAIEHARASGATQQTIDETTRQMRELKQSLDNPLINAAYTFIEPFPVGVVVSLVSAGILRRRRAAGVRGVAAL